MNKPKIVKTPKRMSKSKVYTGVHNPNVSVPGLSKEEYTMLASLVGTAILNGDYDVLVIGGKAAEVYLRPTEINSEGTASALATLLDYKLASIIDGRVQAAKGAVVAYTEAIWLGGEVLG